MSTHLDYRTIPKSHSCTSRPRSNSPVCAGVISFTIRCVCSYCGKGFTQKSSLNRHIKIHKGIKPYACSFKCGQTFSTLSFARLVSLMHSNCKRHELQHTNQYPYICPYESCGRVFKSASALQYHKKTHTQDRSFICPVEGCMKSYC